MNFKVKAVLATVLIGSVASFFWTRSAQEGPAPKGQRIEAPSQERLTAEQKIPRDILGDTFKLPRDILKYKIAPFLSHGFW